MENEIIKELIPERKQLIKNDFACVDCPFAIWQGDENRAICHCQKIFKITYDSIENYNWQFKNCQAKQNYLIEIENNSSKLYEGN